MLRSRRVYKRCRKLQRRSLGLSLRTRAQRRQFIMHKRENTVDDRMPVSNEGHVLDEA